MRAQTYHMTGWCKGGLPSVAAAAKRGRSSPAKEGSVCARKRAPTTGGVTAEFAATFFLEPV